MRTLSGLILAAVATILLLCEPLDTLGSGEWLLVLMVTKCGAAALYYAAWLLLRDKFGGLTYGGRA